MRQWEKWMARTDRKIVFVIVEGPSDDTALHFFLEEIFSSESVHVEIVHGDITTKPDAKPDNIATKVDFYIRRYLSNYHLRPSDILGIIHIVDADGVYVN